MATGIEPQPPTPLTIEVYGGAVFDSSHEIWMTMNLENVGQYTKSNNFIQNKMLYAFL